MGCTVKRRKLKISN
ncbi:unnamed protein product, partial [Adineta steineri]